MTKKANNHKYNHQAIDKHMLYEASVQNVDESVSFIERVYKKNFSNAPRSLREDFCGSAALACRWVRATPERKAIGLDLDPSVLQWAKQHNIAYQPKNSGSVTLLQQNVCSNTPPVDIVAAFNFSYNIFKKRDEFCSYLQHVQQSLNDKGLFICDMFGGTEAMNTTVEKRRIEGRTRCDGTEIPSFKYYWEHEDFNVINHHILCHIHFKLPGQKKRKHAFSYDWRLWTLPELLELIKEAGFSKVMVYLHGWNDDGTSDDNYSQTTSYENAEGWLAYIVALK